MLRPALLATILLAASPLQAQDIVGLEDCAQARGADKKAGCLQSNVEFLHRLIKKNDAAAQAKLREEAARLSAATARLDELRGELDRLKSALDRVEKNVAKKSSAPENK
jgi:hypothetical protein